MGGMSKKPLKATDRRRNSGKHGVRGTDAEEGGSGAPLANLFNDRRKPNGHGKKSF